MTLHNNVMLVSLLLLDFLLQRLFTNCDFKQITHLYVLIFTTIIQYLPSSAEAYVIHSYRRNASILRSHNYTTHTNTQPHIHHITGHSPIGILTSHRPETEIEMAGILRPSTRWMVATPKRLTYPPPSSKFRSCNYRKGESNPQLFAVWHVAVLGLMIPASLIEWPGNFI
jgi:hypothetical protein